MIRIGIVDFDTSHAVEFTRRLNRVDIAEDQWVDGARVVAGVPGRSRIAPQSIAENAELMRGWGVDLLDDPADLLGKVDAVMVVSVDGNVHRDRALPFLERGVPTFVDKPFACSMADARAMVDAARARRVPLLSSSSLRYAPEVVAARDGGGAIVGASTYGPAHLNPGNPGLFHYGIHPVEMLYALMGPGCERLTCLDTPGADLVSAAWSGGRLGGVRGIRAGRAEYGFTLFGEEAVATQAVGTRDIYSALLRQVVRMFRTGEAPLDLDETLEIVAFLEAARHSAEEGGRPVELVI